MSSYENERNIAIASLRTNHRGYRKYKGSMKGPRQEDRCATGVIAEAFHVPLDGKTNINVGGEVDRILGDQGVTSFIISKNDDYSSSTYDSIADELAKRWNLV